MYLDPDTGFSSIRDIARQTGAEVEEVRRVLRTLPVYQRTLPSFERRNVTTFQITAPPRTYQIDYIFLPYVKDNKGLVGFLLCIELTTRKAYAYPIADKTIGSALTALKKFVEQAKPAAVASDNESAFKSDAVQRYLEEKGIKHTFHAPDDHNAMGILDRMARTLKDMLNKYFVANDTLTWYDVLPKLLKNYNNRPHRGLDGKTPNEMEDDEEAQETMRAAKNAHNQRTLARTGQFKSGDLVRVREPLDVLEKGRPRYSDEVYTVEELRGLSYRLRNEKGNLIRRAYRPYELVGATLDDDEVKVVDVIGQGRKANRTERKVRAELGDTAGNIMPRARRNAAAVAELLTRDLLS